MKATPTLIASPARNLGIAVLEFEGSSRMPLRDAVGFYYTVQLSPDGPKSRVEVVFSGTVFYIDTTGLGVPLPKDHGKRFQVFSEAAIGDYLDDHGLPPPTPSGVGAVPIECFSPHFQAWQDRQPASDNEIEEYISSHLFWSWRFAQNGWCLGSSDYLRLHRPPKVIERIISLHEGSAWTVSPRKDQAVWIKPLPNFLRERCEPSQPSHSPPGQARPDSAAEGSPMTPASPPEYVFVDEVRIADLRRTTSSLHDLRKLIALCEELNQCYRSQCYHAVAALTRAILDHVPPIFGQQTFAAVANNHGPKSFKDCMNLLETTARKIADMHLHTRIRAREALPTRTQVNFSHAVDVLLAEVVRYLGEPEKP